MYKVHFEADVQGLASVKRFDESILVESETPKGARDKAESYIKSAYSDTFAILEVVPVSVIA